MTDEAIIKQLAQITTDIGIIKHILIKTGIADESQMRHLEAEATKNLEKVKTVLRAELSRP